MGSSKYQVVSIKIFSRLSSGLSFLLPEFNKSEIDHPNSEIKKYFLKLL